MEEIKGLHLAEQGISTDEGFRSCQQMGVEYLHMSFHLKGQADELKEGHHNVESLTRMREKVEKYSLKIGTVGMPPPSTVEVDGHLGSSVLLGAPERDRDIERMCRSVEAAGKAGIPLLMWNFGGFDNVRWLLRNPGVTRGASPLMYTKGAGRGGTMAPAYDYDVVKKDIKPQATVLDPEEGWERIAYVVEKVMPVAEEYEVRMASHPNDIPIPPGTAYKGVTPLFSNIEGLKRFVNLYDSPYYGTCFCQGCVAEFSTDLEKVYDAISYFGERKKIFWIHFRNIRGRFGKFKEVYHDEGDIDMYRAMRTYRELGVSAGIVPDHMPIAEDESEQVGRSHAFALGYIRALIQVVNSEDDSKKK